MSNVSFVQVNARNLQETVEKIRSHKSFKIGFEILEKEIIDVLHANIDPQHTGVKYKLIKNAPENKSASKYVLEALETIYHTHPNGSNVWKLYVLPSKLDLDCIVACVLWLHAEEISTWDKTSQAQWDKLQRLAEITNQIDVVDCGLGNVQGNEWNPEHQKSQLINEVTWYQVLSAFLSDFKIPLDEKINKVWQWLNDFSLAPFETWERQVRLEKMAQTQSTITLDPVPLVVSQARGATGVLYSVSPYGVCYNPEFPVKDGTVRKFTVCEFTAGRYLDLPSILAELNEIESGWGGNLNAGIIGSPFAGTNLSPQTVCEIVSRHVK